MMPPEQENVTPSGNRTGESVSVPCGSASNNNVSPCMEEQSPVDHAQHAASIQPSKILRQSLHPITLKFEDVSYSIKVGPTGGGRGESGGGGGRRSSSWCCWASDPIIKPKATRTVLNGVSGLVRPGELLAMLGPSGSGKTTLLTALAGRSLPSGEVSGSITYNGHPFSGFAKRRTGFVTQDDFLYPHLTVVETLTYAALLRLPRHLTRRQKLDQAEAVLLELGLARCRNTMIGFGSGGPGLFRGLSGGERKRVSVGQEMLVNPALLLLDEPTSGLDSTTAQRILATLRGLARGGRTVITTIHQPSSRLYRMFDKVLVLSDGCPIYCGDAGRVMDYFGSIGFAPGFDLINPADFLLDLANGIAPDTRQDDHQEPFHVRSDVNSDDQTSTKQSLISSYKKHLHPILKAHIQDPSAQLSSSGISSSPKCENQWSNSWWEQFNVLLRRGLRERKHESYSGLRIFQVMSVSVLAGLLWWHSDPSNMQDQVGLIFFFSIFWGFFPLFNAIFAFPQERPMLIKERSSRMYRLSSYFVARMAGDLPMELVLPTLFTTTTYWMGGLKPSLGTFTLSLLTVLLNVLVSQGLGLALGAVLMDVKQGTTLASVTMLVFLLAGGYYIQHMPPFIAWLKYISFSHYCYKLLIAVQYSTNEVYSCGIGMHCRVLDFPAIRSLGIHDMWWDVAALVVMLIGYRLLAYAALRFGQPH